MSTDVSEVRAVSIIRAACTSETSVDIQLRTRQYIPEDSKLHTRHREYLKSHMRELYICMLFLCLSNATRMALNVKPLQSQIQQMLLRWFGHVARMPESRWRGSLDTTVEEPKADLGPNGRTTSRMHCSRLETGLLRAQDRKIWHALCQTSTSDGRRGSTK
jgi:hypothetical protein